MAAVINWASYFDNILPPNTHGVVVVLENSCKGAFTYEIKGKKCIYLGAGDLHDPHFDYLEKHASFEDIDTIADGTKY
jgi:hypothetical protein